MKINDLKKHLQKKLGFKENEFKRFIKHDTNDKKEENNDDKKLKIIGITGSRGKSTVANLVHEYLKSLGYKSVLYSSIKVDSPTSIISSDEGVEISFSTEEDLLEIIECTKRYNADYLVLEVNESTINKAFTKDIPFDVRVLTNLNPKHNLDNYTEEEYVKIKKSFFENIEDDCICVYGLQDYDKKLFDELMKLNNMKKITFSSNHICEVKDINPNNISCLLTDIKEKSKGYDFTVKINNKEYTFSCNDDMKYSILNYLSTISILIAIDEFNSHIFNNLINKVKLPGRLETYKVNDRTIVIDFQLSKVLEEYKQLKQQNKVNKIKVVVGSIGSGFITWEERFNDKNKRHIARKYAMNLLKESCDYVYLTESDNASESVKEICEELQGYLGNTGSVIIESREEAIKKAIEESNKNDVILILGRGNRRILCNTSTTMKLVKDSEVVEKVLKDLKWF